MNRWFRFYDDALDDPKVQRLPPNLFRAWVNLLCIASKCGGKLPGIADISFKLRMSECDAKSAIEDLMLAGLIDISNRGEMTPHNWNERQFASDSSKDRTRKWRDKKDKTSCDVTVTDGVTASDEKSDGTDSDTDSETNTDSEPKFAREAKFGNGFLGKGSRGVSPRLKAKAEGLALDVGALEAAALLPHIEIPNAKFKSLVAEKIREQHPVIRRDLILAALTNGNDAAWGQLQALLVGAA